ncbi:insulin-like growth factor-binding protein complex acid labile subunit [Corticium candelabrum]|uniref:insulin-like growth factor-binding protein complex acid labile subunit n=1 Tax=Corticium candelabrum TaxID=121492 RepID=UPI002E26EEE5|nr:insulin-like growth factor-binding protein complex acid labile subunit [Corticium candelabrum]
MANRAGPNGSPCSLQGGVVTELHRHDFANLPMLSKLELNWNDISVIRPEMFEGLDSIYRLILRGNKIKELKADFLKLPTLASLYLDYNQIRSIDRNAFRLLKNLHRLNLGSNPMLSKIGPGAFYKLPLTTFTMYNANLTLLTKKMLPDSPYLKEIMLFNNKIQRIKNGAFDALGSLINVYLQQNPIRHFSQKNFKGLNSTNLRL